VVAFGVFHLFKKKKESYISNSANWTIWT